MNDLIKQFDSTSQLILRTDKVHLFDCCNIQESGLITNVFRAMKNWLKNSLEVPLCGETMLNFAIL